MAIEYIGIENFRNHKQQSFDLQTAKSLANIIGFVGKNGVGKTNILEAISMIDGSKGIRSAKVEEIKNKDTKLDFKILIDINGDRVLLEGVKARKKFTLNGSPLKSFFEVSQMISTIWVSSELEYLFAHSQSTRRDFFDKITFCFFNNHYALLAKAQTLASERLNALLQINDESGFIPQSLLPSIEYIEGKLSDTILEITQNRISLTSYINLYLANNNTTYLASVKQVLKYFEGQGSITKQSIKDIFVKNRLKDKFSKQTNFSHLKVTTSLCIKGKNVELNEFSAGEIKFILTELCFAFAASLKQIEPARNIILLLDDLFAKLDAKNLSLIIKYIEDWHFGQVFFSSTSPIPQKEDDPRYKMFVL